MKIQLRWAGSTHDGSQKPRNDDSLIAFSSSPSGASELEFHGTISTDKADVVFVVSDGVGGANAGDLASSLILMRMSTIVPVTFKLAASGFFPERITHLEQAVQSVHDDVNRAGAKSAEQEGMSATLAMIWFAPENAYIANVGDSRIYLSRGGELQQLSIDHTTAWGEWKRGIIGEVEYRNHPRRSALYEVIGGGHQHISPHLAAIPYHPGDRYLVCSDGLIDGVWERHIRDALAANSPPDLISKKLLERSIDNCGEDDTSLFVIEVLGG